MQKCSIQKEEHNITQQGADKLIVSNSYWQFHADHYSCNHQTTITITSGHNFCCMVEQGVGRSVRRGAPTRSNHKWALRTLMKASAETKQQIDREKTTHKILKYKNINIQYKDE